MTIAARRLSIRRYFAQFERNCCFRVRVFFVFFFFFFQEKDKRQNNWKLVVDLIEMFKSLIEVYLLF